MCTNLLIVLKSEQGPTAGYIQIVTSHNMLYNHALIYYHSSFQAYNNNIQTQTENSLLIVQYYL